MDDPELDIPEYSYNARKPRPGADPVMRRLAIAAACFSIIIIGAALAWSGVRPHFGLAGLGPPPEIAAPSTPLRIVPANPGGLSLPGAAEPIMSGDTETGPAQLAPEGLPPALQQLQQAAGTPPPAFAPAPALVATPSASAAGTTQVQLAATANQAGVHKIWSQLSVQLPGLLAGKKPIFMQAQVAGQTIWRLRLGGFADQNTASLFCQTLIAKGAACTVAAF